MAETDKSDAKAASASASSSASEEKRERSRSRDRNQNGEDRTDTEDWNPTEDQFVWKSLLWKRIKDHKGVWQAEHPTVDFLMYIEGVGVCKRLPAHHIDAVFEVAKAGP